MHLSNLGRQRYSNVLASGFREFLSASAILFEAAKVVVAVILRPLHICLEWPQVCFKRE